MGRATLAGGHPAMKKPSIGLPAPSLAVGSRVYLLESGVPVEYLVVNQGIPSDSTLYDESCDGVWLLRKDVYEKRIWDSTDSDYQNSDIHAYLNSTFLSLFDSNTQNAIKAVKIPYLNGYGGSNSGSSIAFGSDGLETQIFLLSAYEVGFGSASYVTTNYYCDGEVLTYFTALSNAERIAYLNGTAESWWLRTVYKNDTNGVLRVRYDNGSYAGNAVTMEYGIRPALILPSTAIFDEEALLFKGVA